MTLLAERPTTTETAPETAAAAAAGITAVETPARGGSYVTLPAGIARDLGPGTYVTVPGPQNVAPVRRGSYVTAAGAPTVDAARAEGSYVTLPMAA